MAMESDRKFEEVLEELGASERSLTEEERMSLDERGFVVFHDVLDDGTLCALREKYEELMRKEGASAGMEVHQEQGTRRLSDLVNKGEVFDAVYLHPKVLAAARQIIGRPFQLSSLNARDAIPGEGLQALHADWGRRRADEPYHVCNSIWLIDDFTEANGATRLVPGTHKTGDAPADVLADPSSPHPDEVKLIAPAGAVCVFNAHVWHGGTLNRTDRTRRALHAYYVAREWPQQLHQAEYIRKRTYDRLSPAARYILNV